MTVIAVVWWLALASPSSAAPASSLSKAQALDFRIDLGRDRWLLRISRESLERLAESIALGQTAQPAQAMAVREDQYPPRVSSKVPAELGRRAAALWRLVQERGWTDVAGVEWDPKLGAPRAPARANDEGLRDAPVDLGSRAGVWAADPADAKPLAPKVGVRCVEALTGPSRCFRVWRRGTVKGT